MTRRAYPQPRRTKRERLNAAIDLAPAWTGQYAEFVSFRGWRLTCQGDVLNDGGFWLGVNFYEAMQCIVTLWPDVAKWIEVM